MVYLGGAVLAGIMKVKKKFNPFSLSILVCEMMLKENLNSMCCRMHQSSGSTERTIWKKELIV